MPGSELCHTHTYTPSNRTGGRAAAKWALGSATALWVSEAAGGRGWCISRLMSPILSQPFMIASEKSETLIAGKRRHFCCALGGLPPSTRMQLFSIIHVEALQETAAFVACYLRTSCAAAAYQTVANPWNPLYNYLFISLRMVWGASLHVRFGL